MNSDKRYLCTANMAENGVDILDMTCSVIDMMPPVNGTNNNSFHNNNNEYSHGIEPVEVQGGYERGRERRRHDKCREPCGSPTCICPQPCPVRPVVPPIVKPVDCQGGGLGFNCLVNQECAAGLSCVNGRCECTKPLAPTLFIGTSGNQIFANWTRPANTDYFNVFLTGPQNQTLLFFQSQAAVFGPLPAGSYTVTVYAGSTNCGVSVSGGTTQSAIPILPQ